MSEDRVQLTPALCARLARFGADVARASTVARVPASGELSTDQYFAFWEALQAHAPTELAFRMATETPVHEYDLPSLAALHSPDLGAALDKVVRYKLLCGPKRLVLDPQGDELAIHTHWLYASRPMPALLVDASLATLLVLVQRGSGLPLAPKRIELSRAPVQEAQLARFFGCPIQFRAARDALVLEERLLATPFVMHNQDLVSVLVPSLEQKLAPLALDSFLDQVRAVVGRHMTGERPSVEKVARELSLSTRTLQRRLGELGSNYQQLLDQVRHQTALRLLRAKQLDLHEIAFLLGFEELNSFTRAFRGWEGTTPHGWRDAMNAWRDPI
jgi:AraC-like DNA-binding protein